MHNAILISNDAKEQRHCSQKLAQQLLSLGLANITQFYPYTIQLKKGQPFNPQDPLAEKAMPSRPDNPPFLNKKRAAILEAV